MAEILRGESPAGKAELEILKTMKVGDIRRGLLFPALEIGVEWTCTKADSRPRVGSFVSVWEFNGSFFGQPLCTVVITWRDNALSLDVRPV